jgi:hypothetical protein
MSMRSEDILFELKPCHECPYSCVEGQPGVKCPYDKMAEDLIYAEELAHIEMMKQRENENI